jgi:hypothetical protein
MEICHFLFGFFFMRKKKLMMEIHGKFSVKLFFVEFLGIEKLETFRLLSGEFCFFNILGK